MVCVFSGWWGEGGLGIGKGVGLFCSPSEGSQSFVLVHDLPFKKNDLTLIREETRVMRYDFEIVRGNR